MSAAFNLVKTCAFSMLPQCMSFENSDRNTGFMQLYNGSAGGGITAIMTNCSTGYGFVYNGGVGYSALDGVDDNFPTTKVLSVSSLSDFTIACNFSPSFNGVHVILAGDYVDANNYWLVSRDPSNNLNFFINVGGTLAAASGLTPILSGNTYDVEFIKQGSLLQIYINGVEDTYAYQLPYVAGPYGFSVTIGRWDALYGASDINSMIFWDSFLTQVELATIRAAGPSIGGLVGTDNYDGTMELKPYVAPDIGPTEDQLDFINVFRHLLPTGKAWRI